MWNSGVTKFLDSSNRPILYGTLEDDIVSGLSINGSVWADVNGVPTIDDAAYAGNGVVIIAGAGNDTVIGSNNSDILKGGNGHDKLSGLSGADTIEGGAGNDILSGGNGSKLYGGSGNDFFGVTSGAKVMDASNDNNSLNCHKYLAGCVNG